MHLHIFLDVLCDAFQAIKYLIFEMHFLKGNLNPSPSNYVAREQYVLIVLYNSRQGARTKECGIAEDGRGDGGDVAIDAFRLYDHRVKE